MFQVDYFPSVDKSVIQLGLGDSYFISQKDILHGRINLFFFLFKKHHLEPVEIRYISKY